MESYAKAARDGDLHAREYAHTRSTTYTTRTPFTPARTPSGLLPVPRGPGLPRRYVMTNGRSVTQTPAATDASESSSTTNTTATSTSGAINHNNTRASHGQVQHAAVLYEEQTRPHGAFKVQQTLEDFLTRPIGVCHNTTPPTFITPMDCFHHLAEDIRSGQTRTDYRISDTLKDTEPIYDIRTPIHQRPRAYVEGVGARASTDPAIISDNVSFLAAMRNNPQSLLHALRACCYGGATTQDHLRAHAHLKHASRDMYSQHHVSQLTSSTHPDIVFLNRNSAIVLEIATMFELLKAANMTTNNVTTKLAHDVETALRPLEHTPTAVTQSYNTAAAVRTTICFLMNIDPSTGVQCDPWDVITHIRKQHPDELWYTTDIEFNKISNMWESTVTTEQDTEPSDFWNIFTHAYSSIDTATCTRMRLPEATPYPPNVSAATTNARMPPTHNGTAPRQAEQTSGRATPSSSSTAARQCNNFASGYCSFGAACHFKHTMSPSMSMQPPVSPNLRDLCWQCNTIGHYAARCPELHHRPPVFSRAGTAKTTIEYGKGRAPMPTTTNAPKKLSLVQKINMYGQNYLDTNDDDSDDGMLRHAFKHQHRRTAQPTHIPPPPPQSTDTPTDADIDQSSTSHTQSTTSGSIPARTDHMADIIEHREYIARALRAVDARIQESNATTSTYRAQQPGPQ